jgi:hypothetical protein
MATCLRLALGQELSTTAPFTTYSLVVIFMALAGGFWPGMVSVTLSLITGSILFLPPPFSFTLAEGAIWTLFMFALFGCINVALVSGLMAEILLHDDHQQFLIRELKHRSQNLFAVIQAIVSRTLAEGQTLSDTKKTLETRLAALTRSHAMLAESGWTGAPLNRILSEELISFAGQVSITGCAILLNTPAAQNFALICTRARDECCEVWRAFIPSRAPHGRGQDRDRTRRPIFPVHLEGTGGAGSYAAEAQRIRKCHFI